MKNIILASAAAISLGGASMALAGGPDQPINTPAPKGGLYAGISVGAGALDMPDNIISDSAAVAESVTDQDRQNNWGFAGRLEVGYLMDIRSNLLAGVELGYNYLPQTKYNVKNADNNNSYKYTSYSLDALGVARYLLQDGFNVFGKAGFAYVDQTAKLTSNGVSAKDDVSRILPEVVLGAGYDINSNVEATVSYAHVFGDNVDQVNGVTGVSASTLNGEVPSSNTILFGVDYKFAL